MSEISKQNDSTSATQSDSQDQAMTNLCMAAYEGLLLGGVGAMAGKAGAKLGAESRDFVLGISKGVVEAGAAVGLAGAIVAGMKAAEAVSKLARKK